jgi:hypothetical protein
LTVGILADRRTRLEAEAARHVELADAAVLDELDRLPHRRPAAVHRSDLDDPVVPVRRVHHLAAFPDGVRRRLLDVDVLAGLHRPDAGERVPVVRRRDDDGGDVLVVHDAPEVLHEGRLEGGDVFQARIVDARVGEVAVDVAQRLDLDVRQPREAVLERVPLRANADARQHHAIVGAEDPAADMRRRVRRGTQQIAADGDPRRGRSEPRREIAPRHPVVFRVVLGHADLPFEPIGVS